MLNLSTQGTYANYQEDVHHNAIALSDLDSRPDITRRLFLKFLLAAVTSAIVSSCSGSTEKVDPDSIMTLKNAASVCASFGERFMTREEMNEALKNDPSMPDTGDSEVWALDPEHSYINENGVMVPSFIVVKKIDGKYQIRVTEWDPKNHKAAFICVKKPYPNFPPVIKEA